MSSIDLHKRDMRQENIRDDLWYTLIVPGFGRMLA